MQNASKRAILQAMTENTNVNAATLQALQHITIVAAIDQSAVKKVKKKKLYPYTIFHLFVVW